MSVQSFVLCRSSRELSNDYLLEKSASIQPRTSPPKIGLPRIPGYCVLVVIRILGYLGDLYAESGQT